MHILGRCGIVIKITRLLRLGNKCGIGWLWLRNLVKCKCCDDDAKNGYDNCGSENERHKIETYRTIVFHTDKYHANKVDENRAQTSV